MIAKQSSAHVFSIYFICYLFFVDIGWMHSAKRASRAPRPRDAAAAAAVGERVIGNIAILWTGNSPEDDATTRRKQRKPVLLPCFCRTRNASVPRATTAIPGPAANPRTPRPATRFCQVDHALRNSAVRQRALRGRGGCPDAAQGCT